MRILFRSKKKIQKRKTGVKLLVEKRLSLRKTKRISSENKNGNKVNCRTIIDNLNLDIGRRTINNYLLKLDFKNKQIQQVSLSKNQKQQILQLVSTWIHENIDWQKKSFLMTRNSILTVLIIGNYYFFCYE